jgi:hypothetical protein
MHREECPCHYSRASRHPRSPQQCDEKRRVQRVKQEVHDVVAPGLGAPEPPLDCVCCEGDGHVVAPAEEASVAERVEHFQQIRVRRGHEGVVLHERDVVRNERAGQRASVQAETERDEANEDEQQSATRSLRAGRLAGALLEKRCALHRSCESARLRQYCQTRPEAAFSRGLLGTSSSDSRR